MNQNRYAINLTMINVDIIDLSVETQGHIVFVCWTLHFFPSMNSERTYFYDNYVVFFFFTDDHSRVLLSVTTDDSSDYINANYINVNELYLFFIFRFILSN